MQIRITAPLLEHGPVQWTRGQIAVLPDELGQAFVDAGKAVTVPFAEQAIMPRPQTGYQTAVMPRPIAKPQPPKPADTRKRR